ncbi:hypothetical protein BP00DRAFT_185123 [Aspergillus indologenus CBS 114.80]|uniref:Uncharacterized protein n=1 Tax=Aspergillus indologenus CBS 114.80 TaxID=1450541 RepID=A0A2V5I9X1_9EURO|nr:hypothetical protein BP00DRAFT_185123 [Aspergillus indologenus CBS 114.80]
MASLNLSRLYLFKVAPSTCPLAKVSTPIVACMSILYVCPYMTALPSYLLGVIWAIQVHCNLISFLPFPPLRSSAIKKESESTHLKILMVPYLLSVISLVN